MKLTLADCLQWLCKEYGLQMNIYKFEQRRKKRGDHCVFAYTTKEGTEMSCLCGCGTRNPPSKKYKKRIIRRKLKNDLRKDIWKT